MLNFFRHAGASCVAILTFLTFLPAGAKEEFHSRRLTLKEALEEAFARSPILRARQAGVEQARARMITARTYPFNPEISVFGAGRDGADGSTTDRGVELGQDIEIGGQRRRRVEMSQAELDAAEAQFRRDKRLLGAQVQVAFVEALRARELLEVEKANIKLARTLAEVARKRFDSGAATLIEVNLALAQLGRNERTLYLTEAAYLQARAFLAETAGLDPAEPPGLTGGLEGKPRELPSLPELLGKALEHREDLKSLRHTLLAAKAQRKLTRREVIPTLHVGAFYEREEGTDRVFGGSIGIRIPIFNRNQGAIAEAQAAHAQVRAEREAVEIQIRQQVTSALSSYRAASLSTQGLKLVLGNLRENLDLLQRSLVAGKIGWTEVLLFRREFTDAQRDYVESLAEARLAGIELDLASGLDLPVSQEEESGR